MLFDTHAHYDHAAFDSDRHELLAGLPARGVSLVLCPGSDVQRSRDCVALARAHEHVYAAVGIHPQESAACLPSYLRELSALLREPKVRAVGEIGLDYYYDEGVPHPVQEAIFRAQMDLAAEHQKPVIIHDRDAHADCMRIVRDYPTVRGVFHCYAGGVPQALELCALGYLISFTGTISFKNARRAPEVIRALPLSHIMIETDAPYMAPVPYRGKRCDSSMVYRMAEEIAQLKNLPYETVVQQCTENGKRLFGISERSPLHHDHKL